MKRILIPALLIALFAFTGTASAIVAPPGSGGGGGGGGRGPGPRPPGVPPVGWVYRYLPPVYRTISEQTWIPDRTEWVQTWVEITPGRLERVWRQVVTPGHWQTSTRQVLVAPGRWELVRLDGPIYVPSPPIVVNPPIFRPNPGTVGVEIYGQGRTEDLGKFSPLSEWPDRR